MEKRKWNILQIFILSFFVMLSFALILFYKNSKVERLEMDGLNIDNEGLVYNFDTIEYDHDEGVISGWAYKAGEDIGYSDDSIVLKNIDTECYYKVNTKFVRRVDVTKNANDGFNYDNSGFYSKFLISKLKKGRYQICLRYFNNDYNILCETDEYLIIQ